jgi:hypothetical protein
MPGSTPIFGFPYPDPSDLVANYPALGQQLAEDVEDAIVASGKIKQIVRSTDTTNRSTTSATMVDVTGMSVTITPQAATSTLYVFSAFSGLAGRAGQTLAGEFVVTDSSNATISGAGIAQYLTTALATGAVEIATPVLLWGVVAAVDTTARTYKLRFNAGPNAGTTITVRNATQTGQMFAIEIGA